MFKEGDKVRNVAQNVVGTVIEVDGNTVYIEQDNGCEMDFPASSLVLENSFQKKHDTSVRDDSASRAQGAVYDKVLANVYPAIMELGQIHHAAAEAVPGVARKGWDELSALQKLNAISDATDVPVKAWIDANEVGAKPNIGALQLSILAKRGGKG